ncbi:unnamed protein product [Vitrella brassicaformis CCMP3155]|uniref:Protein unc-45 homolog B n=3 Tax=Vitrella brassicaformis TaxID=1169539 RepID=A0A0G4GJD7_VITBC|nr:unnamed protein product [Vitrella brassicaformis CCMP3155]|eukprot:CEM30066.1 unnamed protein product [Vitrella brassicaformis CCMP3155]
MSDDAVMPPEGISEDLARKAAQLASVQPPGSDDVDDFLERVEDITATITSLVEGKVKPEEVDDDIAREERRQRAKLRAMEEAARAAREADEKRRLYGREGKGEGDKYQWFCKRCFVEYEEDSLDGHEQCRRCGRQLMSRAARHAELHAKVEQLKEDKAQHLSRKDRWLRWKKSQELLGRGKSINYTKWDYWEPESDEDDQDTGPPIVPEDDPNFKALEKEMTASATKRSDRWKTAEQCRLRGNESLREKDYVRAVEHYQEGLDYRKDMLPLWTNKALAELKLFRWTDAQRSCTQVLDYVEVFEESYASRPDVCFKALTRRALALRGQKQYEAAQHDLEAAHKLFPKDKEAIKLLEDTKIAVQEVQQLRQSTKDHHEQQQADSPASRTTEAESPTSDRLEGDLAVVESSQVRPHECKASASDLQRASGLLAVSTKSLAELSSRACAELKGLLEGSADVRRWFCMAPNRPKAGITIAIEDVRACAQKIRLDPSLGKTLAAAPKDPLVKGSQRATELLDIVVTDNAWACNLALEAARPLLTLVAEGIARNRALMVLEEMSHFDLPRKSLADALLRDDHRVSMLVQLIASFQSPVDEEQDDLVKILLAAAHEVGLPDIPVPRLISDGRTDAEVACALLGNLALEPTVRRRLRECAVDIVSAALKYIRPNDPVACERGATLILNAAQDELISEEIARHSFAPILVTLKNEKNESAGEIRYLPRIQKLLGILVNGTTRSPAARHELVTMREAMDVLLIYAKSTDEVVCQRAMALLFRMVTDGVTVGEGAVAALVMAIDGALELHTGREEVPEVVGASVRLFCALVTKKGVRSTVAEFQRSPAMPRLPRVLLRIFQCFKKLTPTRDVPSEEASSPPSQLRGNICLLISRLAQAQEEALGVLKSGDALAERNGPTDVLRSLDLRPLVSPVIECLRREPPKSGPQQNAAVALTRLARVECYRDTVRALHGFEALHQIAAKALN